MPRRPYAWFLALFFVALIVFAVIFALSALGVKNGWRHWGPILSILFAGICGLVGGIFSVYVARLVIFLCGVAFFAGAVGAVIAAVQGAWPDVWGAIGALLAAFVVGSVLNVLLHAVVSRALAREEAGDAPWLR